MIQVPPEFGLGIAFRLLALRMSCHLFQGEVFTFFGFNSFRKNTPVCIVVLAGRAKLSSILKD